VLGSVLFGLACSRGGQSSATAGGESTSSTTTVPASTSAPASSATATSATASPTTATPTTATTPATIFAVIGDYGVNDEHEAAVANLVASWHAAYVLTTGDDYYEPAGGTGTGKYDESIGAYYGAFLKDITTTGTRCPVGLAPVNAFFPCLGNEDYDFATPAPETYVTYFDVPGAGFSNSSGNERYYDFVEGPIHFFVVNSNDAEPDGTRSTSKQAKWLQAQLAASTATWNIVYDHYPPYSSGVNHGSDTSMRWPFAEWGADVILSGHEHSFERVERDGIVYFVNGLGGAGRYFFGLPVDGSLVRYNDDWGAQKVLVTGDALIFQFWSVGGKLIDSYTVPARR
jgi:tartrate-resistant acid phosphatase type 5